MILFESANQWLSFLFLLLIGFASGFIFDASKYVCFLLNKNKIAEAILDCVSVVFCGIILFVSILFINFGLFRFYLLFAFVIGLFLQRFTIGKMIAKVASVCYTFFVKTINKVLKRKDKNAENNWKV